MKCWQGIKKQFNLRSNELKQEIQVLLNEGFAGLALCCKQHTTFQFLLNIIVYSNNSPNVLIVTSQKTIKVQDNMDASSWLTLILLPLFLLAC